MPLDWKDVISEKPRSKRKRSKLAPVLIGVAALGVVGVASSYIFGRGAAPGEAISPGPPTVAAECPEGGESAPPLTPTIDIELYAKETRLTGVELLAKGKLDEGEQWLRNYLTAPDGREDQALYALGRLCAHKDESRNAEQFYTRLVSEREDSLRAGDALYEIGKLLADRKTPGEPNGSFRRAVKFYAQSRGGREAARWLADDLYEKHVLREIRRSEWERVRDLYSIALPGLDGESPERAELVERLAKLNEWVVFTPYARPKKGYPSNITFHEVKKGDFLGGIAKRYGVTIGSIRSLNGIGRGRTIIRVGDSLKILRGRRELFVDLSDFRLTVWIAGCFFREYEIGIGRAGRTPTGTFRITTRIIDPSWYSPDGDVLPFGDPRNILGTRWLGFERNGAGRGIGIHGSVEKEGVWQGVGRPESNGCVRMRNPDVEELFDFVTIGTEVTIVE